MAADSMLELEGPEVMAARGQTEDSGGGRLALSAGKLSVRGSVRGRVLGQIAELTKVAFTDFGARRAELSFTDGKRWTLKEKGSGGLVKFFREVERELGRPDLVSLAPGPFELVKRYLDREKRWRAAQLFGALSAAWLLFLVVSRVEVLGFIAIALLALWLAAVPVAKKRPRALISWGRINTVMRENSAWLTLAVPVLLLAGAAAGIWQAGRRAEAAERAEETRLRMENERRSAERLAAEEERLKERRIDSLGKLMAEAMDQSRWQDAFDAFEKIRALSPRHTMLKTAWKRLGPEIEAWREKERLETLASGIREARSTIGDKVACESAWKLAAVWGKLGRARTTDQQWKEAGKLSEGLEACRQRLAVIYSQNVSALRAQGRIGFANAIKEELRQKGYAPAITLAGETKQVMTVAIRGLDGEGAAAVAGGEPAQTKSLLERARAMGFNRVELTDGGNRIWKHDLEPEDESKLGTTVLKGFGLDKPLRLEAPPEERSGTPR